MTMNEELFERGIEIREKMWGPAGARDKVEGSTPFTRPLEDLVTVYCFGETWGREEQLGHDIRSMLTIGMLIALGRSHEIRVHVAGALSNGVTVEQIREVLLHAAIYCGIPASVDAFRNAEAVLQELGEI
jgi:4-carboxymuconolactone decarboxylase